jgi:hypothetical protein
MMVKLRTIAPSGARQRSHSPASAISAPSRRAIAKGCLVFASGVAFH